MDSRHSPDLRSARKIHVMGICGAGMGAFAGMLKSRGYDVRGSDQGFFPPMSLRLEEWGIPVIEGYRAENLDWGPDVVIVGNVIRRVNPEAEAMRERELPHLSFPEALAELFLTDSHSTVVTGTHGKTTTTSLLAWLLQHGGLQPGFLIGGIPKNFGRSFNAGEGGHFVTEGDEYDTAYFDKGPKFLHYRPRTAILTSIEFDHADIYRDLEHVVESFRRFVALIPEDGTLIVCGEEPLPVAVAQGCRGRLETYGIDGDYDWRGVQLEPWRGGYRFNVEHRGRALGTIESPLAGRHNVLNTLAATAAATALGLPFQTVASGVATFDGVVKRQDVKGEEAGVLVIDDYAHHPTAVRETIRAIRGRYPGRRLWALFEAESNTSRRRIFQDTYGEVLADADVVVLSKPLKKNDSLAEQDQIDVAAITDGLRRRGIEAHHIAEFDEIVTFVSAESRPGDVILAMSGRDFGGIHDRILESLRRRGGTSRS